MPPGPRLFVFIPFGDCRKLHVCAASQLAPEVLELPFWHATTLASIGREAEAAPIFTAVFAKEPQWVELLGRLPAAGLFPDDAALLSRIRALARRPGGQ